MIGDNISYIRKKRGFTQIDFADALGVTQSAVSHWETGRAVPDTRQIFNIAKLLGVSVDALSSSQPEGKPADETEKQDQPQPAPSLADRQRRDVETMLRAMSDADLEKVYDYVRFVAQNKK